MCNCINIKVQSIECYNQMAVLPIPEHMSTYREARLKEGLSATICIDRCIVDEIIELWSKGIVTYGSCCGHNYLDSFVNVSESDISKMIAMGYVQNHPDENRKDTFKLKLSK